MSREKKSGRQIPIENRLALLTLVAGLIPSISLIIVLWLIEASVYLIALVLVFLVFLSTYCVLTVRQKSQYQFRSLHNLLDAITRGDYSFRGLTQESGGAFGELIDSINSLASTLQSQRLKSEESQLLLTKVVDQIDVAIVAWDQNDRLRLINPAAHKLLNISMDADTVADTADVHSKLPSSLVFTNQMKVGETQVKDLNFHKNRGRFRLYKERFRAEGDTHNLLFLTNVSNILRLEEKKAWLNLVRVLSHEINNSMAPLKSLSNTLIKQVEKREQDPALAKELIDGMSIIGGRAESMADFVQNYHKIAKLPEPSKSPTELKQLIAGLIRLFPDEDIRLKGNSIDLSLDKTQIEQVLINIIKNAIEANESHRLKNSRAKKLISIRWTADTNQAVIHIADSGEGIQHSENLFTPFYTTKTAGSGIGLVFCQQVIEAHGGYLSLKNREDEVGCVVTVKLPLDTDLH